MANESNLPTPVTSEEKFAAKAAGMIVEVPTPVTNMEKYLNAISGSSGDSYTKAETDTLLAGKADVVDGKVPASELPSATEETAGIMSAADKLKLDGITTDTSVVIIEDALNVDSTNAVENGVIARKFVDVDANIAALRVFMNAELYGVRINKNDSNPDTRVEYMYDAVGKSPARMNFQTGKFDYGSWANAFFVKHNYPVMCLFDGTESYKLDPNDHSKKLDGTASDISDSSYGGNAMAVFDCPIWMKFYEDEDYTYFEVASEKLDDDFVDWPYIRANGTHASKIYYPMFEGTIISSKLRSIAGVKATSNTSASEEQTAAQANGTNWSIGDWSHHLWLTVLMTLMGKSTNVQATFGNGNMSGGSSAASFKTNGECMTYGQFYGTTNNSDPMKAFYIENVYANRWKRTLGFYNIQGTYYIKNTPPYTVDETYDGYTSCGSVPSSSNYLKNLRISNGNPVPDVVSGASATTYYSDYFYTNNNQKNMLSLGGCCNNGSRCGPWYVDVYLRASHQYWAVGASLYLVQPE